MPEKDYISNVFHVLQDNLDGFDKDEATFRTKIQDPEYAKNVYAALKDNLDGFERTEEDFYTQVGLKKKGTSGQQPENGSASGSTVTTKTTLEKPATDPYADVPFGSTTIPDTKKKVATLPGAEVVTNHPDNLHSTHPILDPHNEVHHQKDRVASVADFNKKYKTDHTPYEMITGSPAWRHPEDHPKAKEEKEDAGVVRETMESVGATLDFAASAVLRMPAMLYGVFALPQNVIAETTGAPIGIKPTGEDPFNKSADYYTQHAEELLATQREKYDKDIIDEFNEGDKGKAVHLLVNSTIQMLGPMMAMWGAAATGAPAAAVETGAALGFGGEKYHEIQSLDIPESAKMSNALATGMTMSMFNNWTLGKMEGAVKSAIDKGGADAAKKVAEETFKETYEGIWKKLTPVTDPINSGINFAAVTFADNVVDKLTGVKPDVDLREATADSFIKGMGLGLIHGTAPKVYNRLRAEKIGKLEQQAQQVKADADNPEVSVGAKEALVTKFTQANDALNKELEVEKEAAQKYTDEEKVVLEGVKKQVADKGKIIGDPAVSLEVKAATEAEVTKLKEDADKMNEEVEKRKLKMFQGTKFMEETGLAPGMYTKERVDEAKKNKADALAKAENKGEAVPVEPDAETGDSLQDGDPAQGTGEDAVEDQDVKTSEGTATFGSTTLKEMFRDRVVKFKSDDGRFSIDHDAVKPNDYTVTYKDKAAHFKDGENIGDTDIPQTILTRAAKAFEEIKAAPEYAQLKTSKTLLSENPENATKEPEAAPAELTEVDKLKEKLGKAKTAVRKKELQGKIDELEGKPQVDVELQKKALRMSQAEFVDRKLGTAQEYQSLRGASVSSPVEFNSGDKEYSALDAKGKVKGKRIQPDPIKGITKKLDDIVLDLSKAVKKDILFSKKPSSRRSLGSYNPTNAATKIKYREDLDVTAHEIGHALDDRYGIFSEIPEDQMHTMEVELKPFSVHGSTPPAGHPNPKLYTMGEGVAEWIRAYVVNPVEATKAAPNFAVWFDKRVPEDIRSGLDAFGKDIRTFAGATNIEKMKASIAFDASKKKGSVLEFLKPSVSNENGFQLTFWDRMAAKIVNPMRATDVAFRFAMGEKGVSDVLPENDPRILGKLFLGVNDKMDNMLEHGLVDSKNERIIDPVTEKPMTVNWLVEPFDSSSESALKTESEDMIGFMVAERVAEKYGQFQAENMMAAAEGKAAPHPNIDRLINAGGGIFSNMAVVRGVLADMAVMRSENPQKYARLQEGARRYRAYADQMLRYQVEKGRMSLADYNEIRANNAYYVGLGRIMEAGPNEEIASAFHGTGNIGSVTTFSSFKGSDKMIKNPYEFLMEATYKSIKEADRNDIMRAFVEVLETDREMYEGDTNKLATVGRKGSDKDPNSIAVFRDGKKESWQFDDDVFAALKNLQDVATNLPMAATVLPSLLRASVTNFPVFALRNRVRDFQSRMILSKSGTKMEDIFNKPKDIKDRYQLFGAGQAGYYLTKEGFYYEKLQKAIEDQAGTNTITIHPGEVAKRGWEAYQKLLSSSERATRLEEYNAAYRKAKNAGMDNYNANLHAAYQARDLMDFAVMGTWMRTINQIVPFSNAAVQGLRKMVNVAHDDPAGFGIRMVMYSMVPALLTRMAAKSFGGDDEWYQKLPAYQRDLFYNFKIGENKIVAIPKPYELGVMGSFSERFVSKMMGDKNAFDGHAGSVARSVFPFDESSLLPPGVKEIIEVSTNKDFFRDKRIIPVGEENLPIELRNTEYASRLGKMIQSAFGVDARNADFVIKGLTSYYGDLAIRLSNVGAEGKEDQFGWQNTGFEKSDNPTHSTDVEWLSEQYKESGVDNLPVQYKMQVPMFGDVMQLKQFSKAWHQAKSDHDKAEIANTMRDYAEKARTTWEDGKYVERVREVMLKLKEVKSKK